MRCRSESVSKDAVWCGVVRWLRSRKLRRIDQAYAIARPQTHDKTLRRHSSGKLWMYSGTDVHVKSSVLCANLFSGFD